jgi:hypothetical protein
MLSSTASLWLGVAFVLIGAINVWLILQASARVRDAQASTRLIAAHRIGGYLFIAVFCVMGYFMLARLGDAGGSAPPGTMLHITLAMVLSPLLFVKVLVARYYRSYHSFLTPIGLTIFVLSFVLIGITAGPSLTHHARMQNVALAAIDLPAADIDIKYGGLDDGEALLQVPQSGPHRWRSQGRAGLAGDREPYESSA